MRHKGRTMLAAFGAVLALMAVASTSASAALPEFVLGSGEKFPDAINATVKAENSFSGGGTRLGPWFGNCSTIRFAGSVTAAKAASFTIEREFCPAEMYGTEECKTHGEPLGVEVFTANGTLVYVSKSKKEVGLLLGLPETVVTCGSGEASFKGSIVVPLTPVNTKTSKVEALIKANGKGKPNVSSYENEKGETKKAKLEVELGTGSVEGAFEVEAEIGLTVSKALTISG